jgi:O-antigen/teichoic acid export membrane protein
VKRSNGESPVARTPLVSGALRRLRQHRHVRILSGYALSQAVVFSTSLARIPLIVSAIGSDGYGVALAIASLQPWILIVVSSVTNLTRVSLSESFGRSDFAEALDGITKMRQRARQLAVALIVSGVVVALAIPWERLLHAHAVGGTLAIRAGVCVSIWLVASAAPGAMYLGLLHAERKIALTQIFPGIAAVLSLAATTLGWALHLGLFAFVVAPAIAACAPYWLAHLWGRSLSREIALRSRGAQTVETKNSLARQLRPRDLLVMTGAAAPPLFSTGLDPIVLSISTGPAVVAAYGLATRLGLLVVILESALYPLYWANFSRLRAAGDIHRIWAEYRKELLLIVAGTTVLGTVFVLVGPLAASVLGGGKVARPMLLYWCVAVLAVLSGIQTVTLPLLGGVRTAPKVATIVFALIIPNETLSYVLSRNVGAAGPILASIGAVLILLASCFLLIKRDPQCVLGQPAPGTGPSPG